MAIRVDVGSIVGPSSAVAPAAVGSVLMRIQTMKQQLQLNNYTRSVLPSNVASSAADIIFNSG